jgi:uncharacterized DUF497 family protein
MFDWDARKAVSNAAKHGVSFEEAMTVFLDPLGLDWDDEVHSQREPRNKRLGASIKDRILLVVYSYRRQAHGQEKIRIISARQASLKERRAYARSRH